MYRALGLCISFATRKNRAFLRLSPPTFSSLKKTCRRLPAELCGSQGPGQASKWNYPAEPAITSTKWMLLSQFPIESLIANKPDANEKLASLNQFRESLHNDAIWKVKFFLLCVAGQAASDLLNAYRRCHSADGVMAKPALGGKSPHKCVASRHGLGSTQIGVVQAEKQDRMVINGSTVDGSKPRGCTIKDYLGRARRPVGIGQCTCR